MKLKRLYKIICVFNHYNLIELIPQNRMPKWLKIGNKFTFWLRSCHEGKPVGERFRLALQDLGPIWVKFGQMLSTRRDLFSDDISQQLALLQDKVEPFSGQIAREIIDRAFEGNLDNWFSDFDIIPLASASIAQIHTAILKENNRDVVLKVIRPDILPIIYADISLMYVVAKWLPMFIEQAEKLHFFEIVKDYEKTILDELNLLHEASNTITLRRNFFNSTSLYIPEVYLTYCRSNVLVEERIYGVQISDIETLKGWGTNFKLLAERGVEIFFTQVFRDNFFHADMHPGNIFVNIDDPNNPQYIGLDCSIIGSLTKEDQRYLAENFIAFFNHDYRRIAQLYIDSGWVAPDTDLLEFEAAMRMVCEPVFAKPLAEISFGHLLLNLFNTARKFNMEIQPQLVLLEKTLLYIEGLGRQLYPQLDLWVTAKPFLENWLKEQNSLKKVLKSVKDNGIYWRDIFPELPLMAYKNIQQNKSLQLKLSQLMQETKKQQRRMTRLNFILLLCVIILVCVIIIKN